MNVENNLQNIHEMANPFNKQSRPSTPQANKKLIPTSKNSDNSNKFSNNAKASEQQNFNKLINRKDSLNNPFNEDNTKKISNRRNDPASNPYNYLNNYTNIPSTNDSKNPYNNIMSNNNTNNSFLNKSNNSNAYSSSNINKPKKNESKPSLGNFSNMEKNPKKIDYTNKINNAKLNQQRGLQKAKRKFETKQQAAIFIQQKFREYYKVKLLQQKSLSIYLFLK